MCAWKAHEHIDFDFADFQRLAGHRRVIDSTLILPALILYRLQCFCG